MRTLNSARFRRSNFPLFFLISPFYTRHCLFADALKVGSFFYPPSPRPSRFGMYRLIFFTPRRRRERFAVAARIFIAARRTEIFFTENIVVFFSVSKNIASLFFAVEIHGGTLVFVTPYRSVSYGHHLYHRFYPVKHTLCLKRVFV
jgi:hypothetical protein